MHVADVRIAAAKSGWRSKAPDIDHYIPTSIERVLATTDGWLLSGGKELPSAVLRKTAPFAKTAA